MNTTIIYIISTLSVTILVIVAFQFIFRRYIAQRNDYIDGLDPKNPVLTETPYKRPKHRFKVKAKMGIKKRYSIVRKLLYLPIIIIGILLSTLPFYNSMPKTLISIVITSTAIIIGIAAKPILENFISGVVISLAKEINVGDTVIVDGEYGTIEDITATNCVIKLWDWRRLIIPNGQMLNQKIVSYSLYDEWHWTRIEFSVEPGADLNAVRSIAIEIAKENPYAEDFEEPSFWIRKSNQESVICWVAAWTSSPARSWELGSEVLTEILIQLNALNIRTHANYQDLYEKSLFNKVSNT